MNETMTTKMDADEYQRLASRTCDMFYEGSPCMTLFSRMCRTQLPAIQESMKENKPFFRLLNGVMGLNGEAGEVIDLMKKYIFQGHELDAGDMVLELGDVLWYVAESASALGVSLSEVMQRNLEKLRRRYPDGFDPDKSVNRDETAEEDTAQWKPVYLGRWDSHPEEVVAKNATTTPGPVRMFYKYKDVQDMLRSDWVLDMNHRPISGDPFDTYIAGWNEGRSEAIRQLFRLPVYALDDLEEARHGDEHGND